MTGVQMGADVCGGMKRGVEGAEGWGARGT